MKIATLALIVSDGKVLLGFKQGNPEIGIGKLNAPGGKVEEGESLLDCLVRETREESGMELDPRKVEEVAVITFFAGGVEDFQVHIFLTETFTGEPQETSSMRNWYWYPINELDDIRDEMHDGDTHWISQALHGRRFRANVFYERRGEGFLRIRFFNW